MKSLYNKFSNDRRKEYAIRTEILQDKEERYVRKYNLFPEGEQYMDYMTQVYKSLVDRYVGLDRVDVLACNRITNGVEFPFIKGTTLHRRLLRSIEAGDKEKLLQQLEEYLSVVTYQKKKTGFRRTKRFEEVFGEVSDKWIDEPAIEVADIDMIPSNIIINEENGNWTIIDYEWTFLCPIPEKYIRFRSVLFWCNECKGNTLIPWNELMDFLSISPEEETLFRKWEDHFQAYIIDGKIPLHEINQELRKEHMNSSMILSQIEERKKGMNIYVDRGNGYVDELMAENEFMDDFLVGCIHMPDDAKRIKININSVVGFCYVIKMVDENGRVLDYRINGDALIGHIHMMNNGDIVIECEVEDVKVLKYVIYLNRLSVSSERNEFMDSLYREKQSEDTKYRDAYFASQKRIQELVAELEEIKSGRWYRLGQKLKR